MLAHCLIDDICVALRKYLHFNYFVTVFIYLYVIIYIYFLKFILSISLEDHIGNRCAIVCFNVSILGKNIYDIYIYIYIYNIYIYIYP